MKMIETLKDTVIFGVKTNIPFLLDILHHPDFIEGRHNTSFIKTHFPEGAKKYDMTEKEKAFFKAAKQKAIVIRDSSGSGPDVASP